MDRPYSKLKKVEIPKVFLATPTRKDKAMNVETATYCAYAASFPGVKWGYTSTISPEMSRNMLIEDHSHFYGEDWTHAYFVDSDVVPPTTALPTLLSADADVITGIAPIILNDGFYWSICDKNEDDWMPMSKNLPREPFEVVSSGAGCFLIRKEILNDIGWPWFKMEYQPKWENDGEPVKCGEDMYFCRKARSKGYKIMADPFVICKHFNNVELLKTLKFAKKLLKKEEEK